MKKERVLIVHNYYQIPGGEDTVVANEKKMLEDNGHEVFMYTRHNDEINKKNIIEKILLPFETIYSFRTAREIKKIIEEKKIDIVHVHNTLPLISPSVYKAAKECGVRVVQTIHNFRLLCPGATFEKKDKICKECLSKGLKCAVKNNCYRNSKIQTTIIVAMLKFNKYIKSYENIDKYIVLSIFSKNIFKGYIGKNKVYIKPNFCETSLKSKFEIEKERKSYFVYFGRVDKIKGVNFLVKAWRNITNSDLIIIGKGPEENKLKDYIKKNNIDNVKCLGYRNREEINGIIKQSYGVIVPSQWYETFGMVAIESFAVGTTVIASDIGALTNIIENDINGLLFNYNKEEQLIQCINYIINNESERNRLNENSYKDYLEKYVVNLNYKILSKIYRE